MLLQPLHTRYVGNFLCCSLNGVIKLLMLHFGHVCICIWLCHLPYFWGCWGGWLLLLWPSLGALWLAAGGFPGWHLLTVFVLGTILMRSAGCCLNDVADRNFDRHVKRTAQRPVTSGQVSVPEALWLGAALALLAFLLVLHSGLPSKSLPVRKTPAS